MPAETRTETRTEVLDVLIVGAGVSGIGLACHLRRRLPRKSFTILERRAAIGGTWDLFRYPGVRSDSDMCTFGYKFRPWTGPSILADGPAIKEYLSDTAREYDVARRIRFGRKVVRAEWSSAQQCWAVEVHREEDGQPERYLARFLVGCTGYYNHDAGHNPRLPGEGDFQGRIVHPQHWPEDLDYTGRRVVVIGSGATAITLVPAMTDRAAHVTMLQRSPTYVLSVPALDPSADLWRRLPVGLAYRLARARNIALARALYVLSRAMPKTMRRLLLDQVRRQLRGAADMRHFTPTYDPWEERMCVVPNGDLFRALRRGKASVVTDHIEAFTTSGLRLRSGEVLPADIVVKATGLDVQLMGGVEVLVDGAPVRSCDRMVYKGVLLQDVPNAAMMFGYTNIAWTLKVDLACEYLCRLIEHMDQRGYAQVVARDRVGLRTEGTILDSLSAGYIRRAADRLPRQGKEAPWRVLNDYLRDTWTLRMGDIEDGVLELSRARTARAERSAGVTSCAAPP
jgi:monooxygenase